MDGAAQDGAGKAVLINPYNNNTLTLATEGNGDMTFTILISNEEVQPDWNAAASNANAYTPCGFYDLDAQSTTPGSTGYVFSGTDEVKNLNINLLGVRWLNVRIDSYVAGQGFARLSSFTNV